MPSKFVVRKPVAADRPAMEKLYRDYRFKRFQQVQQGLDSERLGAFFAERFLQRSESGDGFHRIAVRDNEIVGALSLIPDRWHSEHYGISMGRISQFVSYLDPGEVSPVLLEEAFEAARRERFAHLSVRVDSQEWVNLRQLVGVGFFLVDCSAKVSRRWEALPEVPRPEADLEVRPYRPEDLDAVRHIASSHENNHFYNDAFLPREKTHALFANWVSRCCEGLAHSVLVLQQAGTILGFVTFLENRALARACGTRILILDFIVLRSDQQGKGLGRYLLSEVLRALGAGYALCEIRTSISNYAALRLYSSFGFQVVGSDFILHRVL